jgi:hypothetical protein
MISWHRFVPYHLVDEYLRLGWCPSPALDGTHHAAYSVFMSWLCGCPPVEPREAADGAAR